ncbi:MAG: PAS domain-containing protein [bacterium]|nr:PAS domain-containing protein [bacterium]
MKDHYLKQELHDLIQSDQGIFEFLQEASLDGLWYWDLNDPEQEWMSPKFWTTLGYDPTEMPHTARSWQNLINPDDLELAKQNLAAHLADPSHPYDQEVRYRHKKGYTVWVRCRGMAIRDKNGHPIRMLGAHNNITRLKETEIRLQKENRQLSAVLENSGLYILSTDIEGRFTYFNEKFRLDFGWHPFVAIGKDSMPSIHPDDHQACIDTVTQCLEQPNTAFLVDLRKPKRNGGWQTNRWHFSAQTNRKGVPDSVLCIGYNISAKKKLEAEYRLLVDNIGDALVTTDLEGRVLYASKSWKTNFNLDQEAALGQPIANFCMEEDRTGFVAFISEIADGDLSKLTLEHRLKLSGHQFLWVETKGNLDSDGDRLIFLIRDISERKQTEQKLQLTSQLLSDTQEMAKVGGWRLDVESGQTTWTEEVYRIHEVPKSFNHNKDAGIKYYHPDDQEALKTALDNAIQSNIKFDHTFQFITPKGNKKWVRITGSPVVRDGKVVEVQGLFQDITEQKQAVIELSYSQEQLTSLTTNIPGAVLQYKITPEGREELLYLSKGSIDLWGIPPEEAIEDVNVLWNAIQPGYAQGLQTAIEHSAREMTTFSFDWKIRHRDGAIKWVNGKGSPKRLPDGSTVWNTIITDITPLKNAQQALVSQSLMQEKLMKIASEYINFPIEEMDSRIQASLKEIGQFINADRVYVIQYDFEKNNASNTHEWCADSIEPVKDSLQNVPMEEYMVFVNLHMEGKNFIIPDISKMEDGPAKTDLQRQQVKSLLTVPMMRENECLGCVGFDSVQKIHDYSEAELKLLKLFSEVLVNTLTRAKNDQELRSSQEQLTKLTASVPGAIYQMEMDPEGQMAFPFMSEGIHELHEGLTPALLKAQPESGFSIIHPEDIPDLLVKIEQSRQNLTPFFADYRTLHANDEMRWHRAISQPEQKTDGTVVWYGIFQDITEQRKLEEIQKFAQELKVKNREMEQFAYVASHDLQEPLRTIRSYSGLLNRRFSDQLGADGQQFLNFIGDASLRMSNLIKGLLEYSQIGSDRRVSKVDCNILLQEVLQDLNSSINEHEANVRINNLPTLQGYKVELRQLFQNLISNAIKFHKPGEKPLVEIGAAEQQGYWQFLVKDNGIGIDPKYQIKIFTIFQRLHRSNDYEGTGIGLAHCKKIVEMHHGRIWLESEEGQGATFFFTLKKGGYDSEAE